MKVLLVLLAVVCVSCSKDKTKVETHVLASKTSELDCERQRPEMDAAIRRMIPEITAIGDPYVERTTGGKAKLTFTIERCASAGGPDTISQNYHVLTYGYVVDTTPTYWYGFYLHKDLNRMIVYDFPTKMQMPLEEIRKTREWMMQWGVRK